MRPFPRRLLLVGTILTGVTGLVYAWMKYLLVPETEWAVINHPLQPWVLKAHLLSAPVLVFGIGAVFFDHILRHVRSGIEPGRRTGLALTAVFAPMIVTGYLIQSITHAGWLRAMVWGHVISSIVYLIFYAGHAWLMAVRRRQRGEAVRLAGARRRTAREPMVPPTGPGESASPRGGRGRRGAVRVRTPDSASSTVPPSSSGSASS